MPTAAPTPAARMPLGDVTACATGGVKNRSRKRSAGTSALEVAHDGREDLGDGGRVAGVIDGGVRGLGDRTQRVEVGVAAVGDGEDPDRPGLLALAAPPQGGEQLLELLLIVAAVAVVVHAVGEQHDGVDA